MSSKALPSFICQYFQLLTCAVFSGRDVKLSNQMYSAYDMSIRGIGFNAFHRGGRLFQEYCVDKFAQIEQERLGFLKRNQSQIQDKVIYLMFMSFERMFFCDEINFEYSLSLDLDSKS